MAMVVASASPWSRVTRRVHLPPGDMDGGGCDAGWRTVRSWREKKQTPPILVRRVQSAPALGMGAGAMVLKYPKSGRRSRALGSE